MGVRGTHFTGLAVAPIVIGDLTTYTVEEGHTGKIHILPDLTADIAIQLPEVFAGAYYEFWYSGTAVETQDWVISTTSPDLFLGGVTQLNWTGGAGGDEVLTADANGTTHNTFTVLIPHVGTVVKMVSDGNSWFVSGQVVAASTPTFTAV